MLSVRHNRGRLTASAAATAIALACGTNYVYSAWAPQFAERLKLSATESNLVGVFGNLGMYLMGVPIGMFVDHRGPRPAVLAGSVLLAIGYFPLHQAYDRATGTVALFCFLSFLSGLGGCMAFHATVKTSALNWPEHRGTATAFPLAAFGLSAFVFSALGSLLFPGDTSDLLMLLAAGTCGITFVGFFFLKVYPTQHHHHHRHQDYQPVPGTDDIHTTTSNPHSVETMGRAPLEVDDSVNTHGADAEPGRSIKTDPVTSSETSGPSAAPTPSESRSGAGPTASSAPGPDDQGVDEHSSLLSSCSSIAENVVGAYSVDLDRSHRVDYRGFQLLRQVSFWQLFAIMGILAGIGIMTINNIGNCSKALWEKFDESVSREHLVRQQGLHVSILSICSFIGRLLSGVGSDFLVKSLHASRVWCLVLASLIFLLAQICALIISDPRLLVIVSALSGIGYGFLFGAFPSIVAESFGVHGLSQNWGFMTLAPVLTSNLFNLFYGQIYDRHSIVRPSGERVCLDGLECYNEAYWLTFGACSLGLVISLWVVRYQHIQRRIENPKGDEED